MARPDYDVITVGGGLGGAALAAALAADGRRVLVLERTRRFQDRVRGEVLVPWGGVEAQRLGLLDRLRGEVGHPVPFWEAVIAGIPALRRDMRDATPEDLPVYTYYHPAMQELVLAAAAEAGAEVRRGVRVADVMAGESPEVELAEPEPRISARLVVVADGRSSGLREKLGFEVRRAPERRRFAGVLFDGFPAPEDTMTSRFDPATGLMSWLFPQGGGRLRAYVGQPAGQGLAPYAGERSLARFRETSVALGVPAEWLDAAEPAGPLAEFDANEAWVEHPYRPGVALLGDAAATSDPTWGQGMSQTLRDVRVLRDALREHEDWARAGHAYAQDHETGHAATQAADDAYTALLLETGREADARRAVALPRLLEDPARLPDTPLGGPDHAPPDPAAFAALVGR